MKVVRTPNELRETLQSLRLDTTVGMVPTMGNLHEGHLALVRRARADCDAVVATIFVNPLQFGATEDLDSYPRSFEADCKVLDSLEVEILFSPTPETMYPHGQTEQTKTIVPKLGSSLCGERRTGHFDGVTTVVAKLFNLVQPDKAYFGEKDWQQLTIIRKMAADLNFQIEAIGVPTVRAEDNLALSSRNQYLSEEQRQLAPQLYQELCSVREAVRSGNTDYSYQEERAMHALRALGFRPDYVAIRDADSLNPPKANSNNRRVFGAAHLGQARLIDNIPIDLA
ncbi:MAG: pantoate--beta-alanine ligase [Gammaproteobacteria bacterium]|nr:pantoate--beta-alanine ligase [Gammaproteobacteria bacterium]MYF38310.1 pantoate--beta-alanine ligase [Gammaproteobacteria bacterium]